MKPLIPPGAKVYAEPMQDADGPRLIRSQDLLGRQGKLQIVHRGERYILRITRQGKLILTK